MRGVFGPAFHAQIDLGDRAVPVALEKAGHLALKQRRERPRSVLGRELGGAPRHECITRCGVLARGARDTPEPEVHLGRGVVR